LRFNISLVNFLIQERLLALSISPFVYYRDMLKENLENERSYDQLPNFTATDVLRLTAIGRNEYIELLNQSRSRRSLSYVTGLFRRSVTSSSESKQSLPKHLENIVLNSWWIAKLGFPSELEVQSLTTGKK
jgi:hypothetical protein